MGAGQAVPTPSLEPPVNTVAPAVTGTATEGEVLSCSTGTWDNDPTSYAYQWQRDDGGGYDPIPDADASTYELVSDDVGCTVRCRVTATNDAGSTSANSNATAEVSPVPFSPTDIEGLVLWLDASTLVGLDDGDPVTTWTDGSGEGNDATGVNDPTYRTNQLNGLPVVRFTGDVDDTLFTHPTLVLPEFTVLVVIRATGDGAIWGRQADAQPQLRIGQSADVLSTYDLNSNPSSDPMPVAQTDFSVVAFRRSGSTVEFFQNGIALGDGSMNGGTANGNTFDQIASFWNSAGTLNGDINAFLVYDSSLSDPHLDTAFAYLQARL